MCVWAGNIKLRMREFIRNEQGAISAFAVVCFLTMFIGAGMGIDFMRQEAHRAELQDAVDRGVLAAATFTKDTDAKATVRAYLRSTNYASGDVQLIVDDNPGLSSNSVKATASYDLSTFFLRIVGISSLPVQAYGQAIQGVSNIEISLALDISGSMARERTVMTPATTASMNAYPYPSELTWGGNAADVSRLDLLRVAASEFVDEVLSEENTATTSISLIPFAGNVNLGTTVFDSLNKNRKHSYSNCIDFAGNTFNDTNFPSNNSARQTEHFQWFAFEADYGHDAAWGWCPSDTQAVTYLANDATTLKKRISEFTAHDGTGTQNAMKVALSLLDSRSNDLVQTLVNAGEVSSDFSHRPSPFGNGETMKVIVLMSDGGTTNQIRVRHSHYKKENGDGTIYNTERPYWATNSLGVHEQWIAGRSASKEETTRDVARQRLIDLCNMARAENVVVFTIGFDLNPESYAYSDLQSCASNEQQFFAATGSGLADAFASIATTITKLRLVN